MDFLVKSRPLKLLLFRISVVWLNCGIEANVSLNQAKGIRFKLFTKIRKIWIIKLIYYA